MKLIKQLNEMSMGMEPGADEIARIVDHWKVDGQGMGDDELIEAIASDLEMLEYSPDEIDRLVPQILQQVRGQ